MDTSLSQPKQPKQKKKKKQKQPVQKEAQTVSKDTLQAGKPNPQETKVQPLSQSAVSKKNTGQETGSQSVARVVLSKVPQQTERQLQEAPPVETSAGQKKKKKKKKKKPKQLSEQQAAESLPEKPAGTPELGCCKLKNLKEITCLELICPHSSKPAAKAFSGQNSNAGVSAPASSKCSQSEVAPNSLTQSHLESLSDAIVKSLASLDKTSISITLVNPENDTVVGEKIVHSLQSPSAGQNSEIVIDICGTSVVDLDKKEGSGTGSSLQDSGTMISGDSVDGKKAGKKNKGGGMAKAVNNHVALDGDKHAQKPEGKPPNIVQKQQKTKPTASQPNEVSPGQAKKEKDIAVYKDLVSATVVKDAATGVTTEKTKAQLKAERKAAFEAENAARLATQKGEGKGGTEKSKAELKAERRALQEAQRAAKAQATGDKASKPSEQAPAAGEPAGNTGTPRPPGAKKEDTGKPEQHIPLQDAPAKKAPRKPASEGRQHEVLRLFSHLHQIPETVDHLKPYGLSGSCIHPAVFRTGLQIAEGVVVGSNARCIAMLSAFRSLVEDYTCDASKRVSQDLREQLDKSIEFLNKCRPLSMSMQNAATFLKARISAIQDSEPADKVKEDVTDFITRFVHEEICLAKKQITSEAQQKILDEDVILTYCCSSLVKGVLKLAHESGKKFRVIVVDSRPQYRGREMLNYLSDLGISCTYVLITAVSYIMDEVTRVVLGASTLLANGYVMGHIGTSQIALVAKSRNVPVLVCCETYKFSERVITDSFALNELGPTSQLVSSLPPNIKSDGVKDLPSLSFLNLMYDVTAPQFVSVVITEKGILPCTSVPVVLRMRNTSSQ